MNRGLVVMIQTLRDHAAFVLVLIVLFVGIAGVVLTAYPTFFTDENTVFFLEDEQYFETFDQNPTLNRSFLRFSSLFFYQWFLMLIGGCIIGYAASLLLSQEFQKNTLDVLLATPLSRKEFAVGKFLGFCFALFIINIVLIVSVIVIIRSLGEMVDISRLMVMHGVLLLYFFAAASLGFLIALFAGTARKSGMIAVGVLSGMFCCELLSRSFSDVSWLGYLSLHHYCNPDLLLLDTHLDLISLIVLLVFTAECILLSLVVFMKKDIWH
ncbi:MAG: ABC transporter permease subunit [Candidatus Thermoplasmatota archaeon]